MAVVVVVDLSTQTTKGNVMDKKLIPRESDPRQCFYCGEKAARELVEFLQVGIDRRGLPTGFTRDVRLCFTCLTGRRRSDPGSVLSN